MTASPGSHTYTSDILGNRTWRDPGQNVSSTQRYTWDEVGRLFTFCTPSSGAKYRYRADGMRVEKIEGLSLSWIPPPTEEEDSESSGYYDAIWATNKPTTRYFYDGQMPMGEDYTNASTYTRTKYGVGARGIDLIEHNDGSSTTFGFPLYDAHGNMVSTLYRSGSSFTKDSLKYYVAWGTPTSTSGWMQMYCANLGHRRDAESGLVYMRARYYEPGAGRFVSQDITHNGANWFTYCHNNPVSFVDESGNDEIDVNLICQKIMLGIKNGVGAVGVICMSVAITLITFGPPESLGAAYFLTTCANVAFTMCLLYDESTTCSTAAITGLCFAVGETLSIYLLRCNIGALVGAAAVGVKTSAGIAVIAAFTYEVMVMSYLVFSDLAADY